MARPTTRPFSDYDFLANHLAQLETERVKEVLCEYFRVWLVVKNEKEFAEYVTTLGVNQYIDWDKFLMRFPQDPLIKLSFRNMYELWSSVHILPGRDQVNHIANESTEWRQLVDIVYQNLDTIESKRKELHSKNLNVY